MKTARLLSPLFHQSGDIASSEFTLLDMVQNSIHARPEQNGKKLREIDSPSPDLDKVIELPRFKSVDSRPNEFFAAVQEWEGEVTGVYPDFFTANLYDMRGQSGEISELAEISYDDIDPADREKVQEGAIFRWLIGHSRTRSDSFSRKWMIYFRRSPARVVKEPSVVVPEHLKYIPSLEIADEIVSEERLAE